MAQKSKKSYGPCSIKQQIVLQDVTTDVILVGGGAGGGKALRHGEKVLTPTGFVNIEDINIGDSVVTPKNTVETVEQVWPQGEVDIYRVTFQDGRTIDCCKEHLWKFNFGGNLWQLSNTARLIDFLASGFPVFIPVMDSDPAQIQSIEEVGKDFATCIAISGDDKLFVTTNYIVTHNSRICLTKNLDGISDPEFRCVILRRYEPELKKGGALIDESKKIYTDFTKIPYKTQAKVWQFPSGAEISFGAISCDEDLGSWQGSQFTRVMVDEAGDKWTEKQILFLQSRMRTADSKIHPQLILTCNPDINSFLKNWVDYSLDPTTGVPVEGTENKIRWFFVEDNKAKWADSPEECYEKYGKPKGLIYAHKITKEELDKLTKEERTRLFMPKSFRFVPTTVYDNPYLLPPKNNSYLASLQAQPYVNQLKYLQGSWTAKEAADGFFKRSWCQFVDIPPINAVSRVRAWDFAASEESVASPNPDFTVGLKMSRDKFGIYYIEDVVRFRARTDKVLKTVVEVAHADGIDECNVTIPKDPGAGGAIANSFYVRTLAECGIAARSMTVSGHSGKITRFKPFAALAESGAVRIVRGEWNEAFLKELEEFTGSRNNKDDQVDATSDAFVMLARQVSIPTFVIPSLEQNSPIPTVT